MVRSVVAQGEGERVAPLGRRGLRVVGERGHDGEPVVGLLELVEGDGVVQLGEGAGGGDQGDPAAVEGGGDLFDQGAQRGQPGAAGHQQQVAVAQVQAGVVGRAEVQQLAGAYLMHEAGRDGAGGHGTDVQLHGAVGAWRVRGGVPAPLVGVARRVDGDDLAGAVGQP
ncbi:hypothetical protein AWV63_13575 [Micromonospora rifamycinica]|nr:hypothetical protein AWV63_13575 [Micromonospora rifamycinica]